jgi:predicted translin family RNA/ssDNA-binding protein
VPVVIYELCESAINFISQESYEKGLILLQKAQTMLEQIQAQNNPHDQLVFLLIMHNMALCY